MTTAHSFLKPNMTKADWDALTDEQWEELSTQEILDHNPAMRQQLDERINNVNNGNYITWNEVFD